MDRLTKRNRDGSIYLPKCFEKCAGDPDYSACEECEEEYRLLERLAAIEDILGDDYNLSYLEALFATLKKGDAVYYPIRPGETVYVVDKDEQGFFWEPIQILDVSTKGFFCTNSDPDFTWDEMVKVFHSQAEAEAALAKIKEASHG